MEPGEREEPAATSAERPADGPAVAHRPAGFWRRAVALGLDLLVVWLLVRIGRVLALPLARRDLLAQAFLDTYLLVVPAAYFVLTHGTSGQTLGKRLVGVRVVDAAGNPVGYLHALARLAATCVSAVPLGLGFLVPVGRRDRRALHDLLAGTRVIRGEGDGQYGGSA